MGNCKDCEHWVPQGSIGICSLISEDSDNRVYMSGVYYDSVELVTQPEFGCVLFEKKESA